MEQFDIEQINMEQTWKSPPEPINQILDNLPASKIILSPDRKWMVEWEWIPLPAISELTQPKLSLAGYRFNPETNSPLHYYPNCSLKYRRISFDAASDIDTEVYQTTHQTTHQKTYQTVDLPKDARIGYIKWSDDSKKLAFTLTQANGLELWVLDVETGTTRRLTEPVLNGICGSPYSWLNKNTLLCKCVPQERGEAPVKPLVPNAPLIKENFGEKRPYLTPTSLLQNSYDEDLFSYYLSSVLVKVSLDGEQTVVTSPNLIYGASPSPDGNFILLKTLHKPFSYEVLAGSFPRKIQVIDSSGNFIYQVADLPTYEKPSTKRETVPTGRRRISWRGDVPSTLYWVEALDEGDPQKQVPFRDALYQLDFPFTDRPTLLWKSEYRFRGIYWGKENLALTVEGWYDTRKTRTWRIFPQQPETSAKLLCDRSTEDKYSNPGTPLTKLNSYGYRVLRFALEGNNIYLNGYGASQKGVYPFLDKFNLETGEKERLWQCEDPYFEQIYYLLDDEVNTFITARQSKTEPNNYFLCNREDSSRIISSNISSNISSKKIAITNYQDKAPQLKGMTRELVQYNRCDGVKLRAKLYLPPTYKPERDGTLPTLLWIYPEEFKDSEFAGQSTIPENIFIRPGGRADVLYLLTQGYAILANPSLPIIGEGDAEPNDTYTEQLITGAQAAVNYLVERGISDPKRIGVGGHSYGGKNTVNLLAHTDLFQMGIARSGAYNRTLTPFGFQNEYRSFWEAKETYIQMSPFTHADKIKAPLLLIHGAGDDHHSTYPIQTERLYLALKGLGANVRYVSLPLERHSYQSREAVKHTLWEMVNWCNLYLSGNNNK
ncbi:MAG: prolyl oligopeptidase family serine peptidase [Cyanobacteria bacterium P01_A01_bin.45]